ncbi:MAG: hypothetical protein ABIS29_05845 [Vicinamibacterales bacterium]
MTPRRARTAALGIGWLVGLAATSYATYVGVVWLRYGHLAQAAPEDADAFLDRFMPEYDLAERHHSSVAAPAEVTFAALMDMDLEDSRVIRAIFRGRELLLGAGTGTTPHVRGLVAVTKELRWGVLADVPGHEIVMGAVTQPWKANVVFRSVPAGEFATFNEPDYIKIAWTLAG